MRKSKRVIAFLMAMSVIGVNTPSVLDNSITTKVCAADNENNSIRISQQPVDSTIPEGTTAKFTVTATGDN